jgi:WD40 repeat protein
MNEPRKVFISYASEERDPVRQIKEVLDGAEGVDVWLDTERMRGGSHLRDEIEKALRETEVFVAVFGGHPRDGWAKEELSVALSIPEAGRPRIVPVVVSGHLSDDDGEPLTSDWPVWLTPFLYVDFRAGAANGTARQALLDGVGYEEIDLGESPYPGFGSYGPDRANDFLGREPEIAELIVRLEKHRFVVIVGASGSGKTSLARAGVVPRLQASGPRCWEVVDVSLPQRAGEADSDDWPPPPERGIRVLVVDEMDRLFVDRGPGIAEAFARRLAEAVADDASTWVLATLRADFMGEVSEVPTLRRLVEKAQFLLPKPEPDELRKAITQPASRHGARVETALVERLLSDYGQRPGSLPLLNETLRALWHRSTARTLTLATYQNELGGLEGALTTLADQAWDDIALEDRDVAREIFVRLALPRGFKGPKVSRAWPERALAAAPPDQVHRVVEALVAARLLRAEGDGTDRIIDVTHDTLFEAWPRLSGWLEQSSADLAALSSVVQAAADWVAHDEEDAYLHRGERLSVARALAERQAIGPVEQAFLDASSAAETARQEAEQRREDEARARRRRSKLLVGISAVAVFVAATVTRSWHAADAARDEAQVLQLAAEANRHVRSERDTSLLLAAEAVVRDANVEARGTLIDVLGATPLPVRVARTGHDAPMSLSAASSGSFVYVGTTDGRVQRIGDDSDAATIADPSTRPIEAVAELADGSVVALDDSGELTRTGSDGLSEVVTTFAGRPSGLAVDVSTENTVAVIDRNVIVIDAEGAQIARWALGQEDPGLLGRRPLVAVAPDGRIVVADGTHLSIGDPQRPAAGLVALPDLADGATSIAVDALQNRLAIGDDAGLVTMVQLTRGELAPTRLRMPDGGVFSLAFSPDGATLAGANDSGRIVIWNVAAAAVTLGPVEMRPPAAWAGRDDPSTTSYVGDLAFVADDTLVSLDREAVVWWNLEPAAGLITREWDVEPPAASPAVTTDGTVVILDEAGVVRVGEDDHDLGKNVTAVTTDGDQVVTATRDGAIRIEDELVVELDDEVGLLASTANGELLAASASQAFVITTTEPGGLVHRLDLGEEERVGAIAAAPGGDRVAVAVDGPDGPAVRTWQRVGEAYQPERILRGHTSRIDALVIDDRGWIFSGGDDRTIRVVDDRGELVQVLTGHGDGITSLAIDGDRVWAGTQNGEVHAWQQADGRYARLGEPLRIDASWVDVTDGSPGELVVATSSDVETWVVEPDQLIERACALAGRTLAEEEIDALGLDRPEACS